jgi:nucleoside-diphosphate-sugar epimerase
MNDKQFIILGASGFIGQHLTQWLAGKEQSVVCISRANILRKLPNVKYLQIKDYKDVIFSQNSIVFHLAEPHHIKEVEQKGASHIVEMESLTKSFLDKNPSRFIYLSSTAVYKDSSDSPNLPHVALSPGKTIYAQAKQAVEKIIASHNGVVVRLTNTYGPGMSQTNIFADIFSQLKNDFISLREATPVRDYLWIEDLVEGLYKIAQGQETGIFNLASGTSISCENLCKLILNIMNLSDKKIKFLLPSRYSVINVDIKRTEEVFSWKARYTLEDGVRHLLGLKSD